MIPINLFSGKNILFLRFFFLIFLIFSLSVGLATFFNDNLVQAGESQPPSLTLSEILPNPTGSDRGKEFIEVFNRDDHEIELDDWFLRRTSRKNKVKIYHFPRGSKIKKGQYLALKTDSLNNDGATIELVWREIKEDDQDEEAEEMVAQKTVYTKAPEGQSYNYNWRKKKWYWALPSREKPNNPDPAEIEYPDIIINEVYPAPSGGDKEFIEIYNPTKETVSLSGWILRDNSQTKYTFKEEVKLKPRQYLVIDQDDFKFYLNNSGEEQVFLLAPNNKIKDKIKYRDAVQGFSWNRNEQDKRAEWYWALPTPAKRNNPDPRQEKYPALKLSEILPNPTGEESKEEFIEIFNPGSKEVKLAGWRLSDNTHSFVFRQDKIKPGGYLVVYRSEFKFAVNNSKEKIYLTAPNGQVVDSWRLEESAPEGLSAAFDFSRKSWHWTVFLTPGRVNKFSAPPVFRVKKPAKIYKNLPAEWRVVGEPAGVEKEWKIVWDFGDGHKSYLAKTKHTFTKKGKYNVKLSIKTSGGEKVTKEYRVEVRGYPRRKLRIVGLLPNPTGADRGREIILIKNKSGHKVNLRGYKIATGSSSKKITRHPIFKDFILRPGQTRRLTQKKSRFNLPNNKGTVKLLYPDDEVADKVKYRRDKIQDDEWYLLVDKNWVWQYLTPPTHTPSPTPRHLTNSVAVKRATVQTNLFDPTLIAERKMCYNTQGLQALGWLEKQRKWFRLKTDFRRSEKNKLDQTSQLN